MNAQSDMLGVLQRHVGGCREWLPEKQDKCWAPAEFVLWGKLIDSDGLGPRCWNHAANYVDHYGLASRSEYALINLRDLAADLTDAEALRGS
jgi:hypothetical protein